MITQITPKYKFTYQGAIINVFHANKNEGLPKHEHTWKHATICHNGSCAIRIEGKERIVTKDDGPFNLPANEWHEIEALEDNTVFVNVFAEGMY